MKVISEVSVPAVPETRLSFAVNVIAIICGLGIVVWLCMATSSLDMSLGFF